jgi:uncharacterized protein YjcR
MTQHKSIAGMPLTKVAELMQVSPSTPHRWLKLQKPLLMEWARERERRVQLEREVREMNKELIRRMTP